MPAGLSGGVTTVRLLPTNPTGCRGQHAGVVGDAHRGLVRGGQHLSRCTVGGLLGERGRGAEDQLDLDAGVLVLEGRGQLGEGLGEAGGGQHGEGLLVGAVPAAGGERQEQEEPGEHRPHEGTSTITFVDFTLAIARTPGSSPSSSAASLLIRDTTR